VKGSTLFKALGAQGCVSAIYLPSSFWEASGKLAEMFRWWKVLKWKLSKKL
jgi:hypothetical protein